MNLLTNYLNKKYNRLTSFKKSLKELNPTAMPFYYLLRNDKEKGLLFMSNDDMICAYLLPSPNSIQTVSIPLTMLLKLRELIPIENISEQTEIKPIEEQIPLLYKDTPLRIPIVFPSVREILEGMLDLPQITEEDEDEEVDFFEFT